MKKVDIRKANEISESAKKEVESLCHNMEYYGTKESKIVAVTSCKDSEGKTFMAFQISKVFAQKGEKTLLIMADFRKMISYEDKTLKGLSEVARYEEKLSDVIFSTDIENLYIVFAGAEIKGANNYLDEEGFFKMMKETRKLYDKVIIDTPTVGMTVCDNIIYGGSDAAVLIIKKDSVSRRLAKRVIKLIEREKCPVIGVVINDWSEKDE